MLKLTPAMAHLRWHTSNLMTFVAPSLDSLTTTHKVAGREPDWLRWRFVFVPPNLLGGSSLFTALQVRPFDRAKQIRICGFSIDMISNLQMNIFVTVLLHVWLIKENSAVWLLGVLWRARVDSS